MSVAPVVSIFVRGIILLLAEAVIHFSFQMLLGVIGEKLLDRIFGILGCLQVVLLYELFQYLAGYQILLHYGSSLPC